MGWDNEKQRKRLKNEAKALNRKAVRRGIELEGRDAARWNQVTGRIVKYSHDEDYDNDTER